MRQSSTWERVCPSCGSTDVLQIAHRPRAATRPDTDPAEQRFTLDAIALSAIGLNRPSPSRSCGACGRRWASAEQIVRWRKFEQEWHRCRDASQQTD